MTFLKPPLEILEKMMGVAIKQAQSRKGWTRPNPTVGCVIVDAQQNIIAEGAHFQAGEPHAEVAALKALAQSMPEKNLDLSDCTLFVTLEPCHHTGRTGPCTAAIIKSGIKQVVIGAIDTNAQVDGGGAAFLEAQGLQVTRNVLSSACRDLNPGFHTFHETGHPFFTLKIAATLDGKTATHTGSSQWITNSESRKKVHQMRAWHDAILVGAGTVQADDPSLTVRHVEGLQPIRIILDRSGVLTGEEKVFQQDQVEVLHLTRTPYLKQSIAWDASEVNPNWHQFLEILGNFPIQSVFCEPGAKVSAALLKADLINEIKWFIAPKLFGGDGQSALAEMGVDLAQRAVLVTPRNCEQVGEDLLITAAYTKNMHENDTPWSDL